MQGLRRIRELAPKQRASRQPRSSKKQREQPPVEFFEAPVEPADPPAKTALSAEPRYSDELFARWAPPAGLSKHFVKEVQDSLRGACMSIGSPTLEQLCDWQLECYEHYAILDAYADP